MKSKSYRWHVKLKSFFSAEIFVAYVDRGLFETYCSVISLSPKSGLEMCDCDWSVNAWFYSENVAYYVAFIMFCCLLYVQTVLALQFC